MNFFPSRGCVYQIPDPAAGSAGAGFYSLEGLTTGQVAGATSVILLQSVEIQSADIIQPIVTLENSKILYSFGTDFGNISIGGELLLGPSTTQGASSFNTIQNYYNTKRVAITQKPVTLSMPGSAKMQVYLKGLIIGRVDPEFHVQPFAFTGIVADP